ncbi:MAG TPA: class I SAM-dependent methyltransferase [Aquihabitans sp.]|nr:class I SAM-dependent methyltransferase [Aquihabitans sp.]
MSPEQVDIVKRTWQLANQEPDRLRAAIATRLPQHPEAGRQPDPRARWIADAVSRLSQVLDRPTTFGPAATAVIEARSPVTMADLAVDRDALVEALRGVLGGLADTEEQAWSAAFGIFSEIVAERCLDPFGAHDHTPAGTPLAIAAEGTTSVTTTTTPTPDLQAVKQAQQQTWSSGNYAAVGARIHYVAEHLAESAELRAGWRVLDVATGSGNAALAAARSGASVVGVDYVPELIAIGRRRAEAEDFDIDFREGDAEDLPVQTGEFDAVLSVFGSMFAPNHERTAEEIVRACRPGGTIGLASWTPSSFVGDMFRTMSRYAPPPAGVASPLLWGDEEHLREIFGTEVTDVRSTELVCTFRFPSAEDMVTFFERYYGPTLKAFGRVEGEDRAKLSADLVELVRTSDTHQDGGSVAVRSTYLQTLARRA